MTETTKKRTRINIVNEVSYAMLQSMPNVISAALANVHSEVVVVAYNIAKEHPEWQLRVKENGRVNIMCGEEELGSVHRTYSSRTRNSINTLDAHRIGHTRRTSGRVTCAEPAALLRKVREFVYPKTLAESFNEETTNVNSVLYSMQSHHSGMVSSAKRAMGEAAVAFALSPQHHVSFLQYEETFGKAAKRDTQGNLLKMQESEELSKLYNEYRQHAGTKYAVASRSKTGWLVKLGEKVTAYADDEVPPALVNLNILKMVDVGTALADIGSRVEEKTFVVVPTETA